MAEYGGHRSWNAWNVSLWIHNDEGLYCMAQQAVRITRNRTFAAMKLLHWLPARTPDGARYNYTCVREAIQEL